MRLFRTASADLVRHDGANAGRSGRPFETLACRFLVASAFALGAVASMGCNKAEKTTAVTSAGGDIAIVADGDGFKPNSIRLKKGGSATLVFTRTSDDTCATEVVFPELNVKKELPKGKPVSIPVPTDKEQTLTFQCGMGMYKSSVVISAN
jgi:plastocyanin domain-containing protein